MRRLPSFSSSTNSLISEPNDFQAILEEPPKTSKLTELSTLYFALRTVILDEQSEQTGQLLENFNEKQQQNLKKSSLSSIKSNSKDYMEIDSPDESPTTPQTPPFTTSDASLYNLSCNSAFNKRKRDFEMIVVDAKTRRLTNGLTSRLDRLHVEEIDTEDTKNFVNIGLGEGSFAGNESHQKISEELLELNNIVFEKRNSDVQINFKNVEASADTTASPQNFEKFYQVENAFSDQQIRMLKAINLQKKLPEEFFFQTWMAKKLELEHNLGFLQNDTFGVLTGASDSYDDIFLLVKKIVESAEWLSNNDLDNLVHLVPLWKTLQSNIKNFMTYINLVEEMKKTIKINLNLNFLVDNTQNYTIEEFELNFQSLVEIFKEKKSYFKDFVSNGGEQWISLGFPMNKELLDNFKSWIFNINLIVFLLFENQFNKGFYENGLSDARVTKTMKLILNVLNFTATCVAFNEVTATPKNLVDKSLLLSNVYCRYCLSILEKLETRKNSASGGEAKIVLIFENLTNLVQDLEVIMLHQKFIKSDKKYKCVSYSEEFLDKTIKEDEEEKESILKTIFQKLLEIGLILCTEKELEFEQNIKVLTSMIPSDI
ncbi:hypothetical protein HK099_004244 [Clydaea vesicula]|uniref:Uncharacterized protein n=1 Tax=Clydaea vesicula TaxID=447962 RepID=A0AAD5U226_9FUNG|nr:hypothetical protein HK099_004244 [Clydaea vesicula]